MSARPFKHITGQDPETHKRRWQLATRVTPTLILCLRWSRVSLLRLLQMNPNGQTPPEEKSRYTESLPISLPQLGVLPIMDIQEHPMLFLYYS